MLIFLLIGVGAAVAGIYAGRTEADKMTKIAQDHRARAARLQVDYERCSKQLASVKANDQMTPKVMSAGDGTMRETGESEGNL